MVAGRIFIVAALAAGAMVLAVPAESGTPSLVATLKDVPYCGEFGCGYKLVFTLTFNGRRFKTLPAGRYTLVVSDQSRVLNFHMTGPRGFNIFNGLPEAKATRTYAVRLTRGRYTYVSDPHASTYRGSFTAV